MKRSEVGTKRSKFNQNQKRKKLESSCRKQIMISNGRVLWSQSLILMILWLLIATEVTKHFRILLGSTTLSPRPLTSTKKIHLKIPLSKNTRWKKQTVEVKCMIIFNQIYKVWIKWTNKTVSRAYNMTVRSFWKRRRKRTRLQLILIANI